MLLIFIEVFFVVLEATYLVGNIVFVGSALTDVNFNFMTSEHFFCISMFFVDKDMKTSQDNVFSY